MIASISDQNENNSDSNPKKSQSSVNTSETKSVNRAVSIATLIWMGSVFLSRLIGLVREQVMAFFFGTGFQYDAYVTAFLLPEILNHFLASGFLSVTFIPIFQKHIINQETDKAWKTFSNLFTIGTIFFCIFIPLTMLFTPSLISILGHDKVNPQTSELTIKLTQIILPAQLFLYWGAFFSAIQMSNHKFLFPALAPLLYNIGIIGCGSLLEPFIGVEGFAWGVLVGAFLGNVIMQIPGILKVGIRYKPVIDFRDPDLRKYVILTIPLILGLGMTFSNEVFFRFFGSYLPEGGVSSINYALRVTMTLVGLFGQATGVAFYPFMTKLAVKQQFKEMITLINTVLQRIAIYLLPISIACIVGASEILTILFQRGSFTSKSVALTTPVLMVYLLGTFSFAASMILVRSFYALQNTLLPMILSTCASVISIPLYIYLSKIWGSQGMAAAAIIGISVQSLLLYFIWTYKYKQVHEIWSLCFNLLKILGVACSAGFLAYMVRRELYNHFILFPILLKSVLVLIGIFTTTLGVSFILYEIFKLQSIKESIKGLLKRK